MLSINGKTSRDVSRTDTMWLRRSELKVKKMFNQQIFRKREVLIEVMYGLSEEELYEINKLEDKKESAFNQKIFKVRM